MEAQRLVEPVPVDDDLCTRLALIEDIGFGARFVLTHEQTCYESGTTLTVVKRKIILPKDAIMPGIEMTLAFLAQRGHAYVNQGLLRLLKK